MQEDKNLHSMKAEIDRQFLEEKKMAASHSYKVELIEGTKHDDGKLPLDLWSPYVIEETAKVLKEGAIKYEPNNWMKGLHYTRVFAALLRHLWAWWRGERNDPESNLHHLAHAMCCLMFLLHFEVAPRNYSQYDNRPEF